MRIAFKTSGHFNHEGRPGRVGGSLPSGEHHGPEYEERRARQREALRAYRARQRAAAAQRTNPQNIFDELAKMPVPIPPNRARFAPYIDEAELTARLKTVYPYADAEILKRMFYVEGYQAYIEGGPNYLEVSWIPDNGYIRTAHQKISIHGDGTVSFDLFSVDDDAQNAGFTMPLVIRQVAMFKMLGAKKAKMYADISIGKYAWAKEGVSYQQPAYAESAKYSYENYLKYTLFPMQDLPNSMIDAMVADTRWRSFTEPHQWATYKIPGVQIKRKWINNDAVKPGSYDIGKAFMLDDRGHGSWEAEIDLTKIGL